MLVVDIDTVVFEAGGADIGCTSRLTGCHRLLRFQVPGDIACPDMSYSLTLQAVLEIRKSHMLR